MSKFTYTARDSKGAKITDSEEASSQEELINRLQSKNLVVISVVQSAEQYNAAVMLKASGKERRFRHYGVSGDDLVIFSRQLATLLGAGVTILKSLDIISKQVYSRRFYNVLEELEKHMEAGLSFHEAMSRYPKIFSELWVNLVESGEASGNLAGVLSRLATYLERRAAFKSKIISSLIYPIILLVVGIVALLFLTLKIIPTFAELFRGFDVKLPLLTQVLIAISIFIKKGFFSGIIITIVLVFMFRRYINTKDGRRRFELFKFKLPFFGEFFRSLVVERFSSEMSTLIESGVPLLYSLEISEHSVSNSVMAGIIQQIKEDVRDGKPLNASLERSKFFEPMVVQMVAIGEEIGELPQMFKRINGFYEEYTETFLARFASMFEPVMLLFMGVLIGIMVMGMFLPIFKIATVSGR